MEEFVGHMSRLMEARGTIQTSEKEKELNLTTW
jgi:hypothetical protein